MNTKTRQQRTSAKSAKQIVDKSTLQQLSNAGDEVWQPTYALTEHWLSDLKFFKDELSFFNKLLTQHLIWLTDDNGSDSLRLVSSKIGNLENKRSTLDRRLAVHRKHLTLLLGNPLSIDPKKEKGSHGLLETSFADFVKEFRIIKKETFVQIEKVLDAEKERANAIM